MDSYQSLSGIQHSCSCCVHSENETIFSILILKFPKSKSPQKGHLGGKSVLLCPPECTSHSGQYVCVCVCDNSFPPPAYITFHFSVTNGGAAMSTAGLREGAEGSQESLPGADIDLPPHHWMVSELYYQLSLPPCVYYVRECGIQ